tara:strand:- start:2837 stop:3778 length:942 start_codon:yes stop_codon:yes gene_type:complete
MSEMTEVGGDEGAGVTIEDASESPGFGSDLLDDDINDGGTGTSSEPAAATDGETEDFDPDSIDWSSVRPDDVPENYRYLIPLGRRLQSTSHRQVDDVRREQENQRIADQERIATLQAQVNGQSQNGQQRTDSAQTSGLDQNWMHQTLSDMGVQNQDDYANGYAYMQIAQKVVEQVLEGRGFAVQTDVDELKTGLKATAEHSQSASQTQSRDRLQTELDGVYDEFGIDNVQPMLEEIGALYGKPGPGGKAHTIRSAYQRLTGASSKPTQQQIRQFKSKAAPAAPTSQGTGDIPAKGELSEGQALSAMQRLLDQS